MNDVAIQTAGERQRLMRDAVVNNLTAPVSAIIGILLVPVMLRALGQDDYGLWIVAMSVSGIIAAIDFGLHFSICRVVAAGADGAGEDAADFVGSAANVCLLTGVAGCLILGAAGMTSGGYLHLPKAGRGAVTLVFWLVGGSLCLDQLTAYGFSVLSGLRRFKLLNLIDGSSTVVWAAGAVLTLLSGGAVTAVATCLLAVSALKAAVTLWTVARLDPAYRFRPGFFRARAFMRNVPFAASSLLMTVLGKVAWDSAPVLIGYLSGPAAAVPFYIGQKFPQAVQVASWRAAEVLFPAVSEYRHDIARSREVMAAGSRLVMVLALPASALLFLAAPDVLNAWLGSPPPGSATIMRILMVTVLVNAASASPLNLLYGRGIMRPILISDGVKGIGAVILCMALIPGFGAVGAAWGVLAPIAAGSVALYIIASHECALGPWKLAAESLRGLGLPILAAVLAGWCVLYFGEGGRLLVVAALGAGGLSYLLVLTGLSGNREENRFVHDALAPVGRASYPVYRRVRSAAAGLPFMRASWHFGRALVDFVLEPSRDSSHFEGIFRTPDPWGYETGDDRKRLMLAGSMLDGLQKGKFRRALEVACAEGMFTEILAPKCETLLALDFAPTALERARLKLDRSHVRFELLDLRRTRITGPYDLITAMDVLDYVFRPKVLKRIKGELVAALEPGGHLLLVNARQDKMFEGSWWGRLLLRGGENIRMLFCEDSSLKLVSSYTSDTHVFALFRKERE